MMMVISVIQNSTENLCTSKFGKLINLHTNSRRKINKSILKETQIEITNRAIITYPHETFQFPSA